MKLASRIVSRAGFLTGFTVQDSPLYGAERRGAPVVASTRLSRGVILERGYVESADAVVVMEPSLVDNREAAVLAGVDAATLVLVNSPRRATELQARPDVAGRVVSLDVSSMALELIGQHVLSAPVAGFVIKVTQLANRDDLQRAVRMELSEAGVRSDLIERNVQAACCAYDTAPAMGLWQRPAVAARSFPAPVIPFRLPRLPARLAAPSIDTPGTSALRVTGGWRVYRPVIDLGRCTRCFLCFALCPEGAIRLDEDNYPVIDYDHCKGCLVCAEECPPQVIERVREEAA